MNTEIYYVERDFHKQHHLFLINDELERILARSKHTLPFDSDTDLILRCKPLRSLSFKTILNLSVCLWN